MILDKLKLHNTIIDPTLSPLVSWRQTTRRARLSKKWGDHDLHVDRSGLPRLVETEKAIDDAVANSMSLDKCDAV